MPSKTWYRSPVPDANDQKFAQTCMRSQADVLADWQKKSAAQRAELTLNAEDAIAR
ncbi:MAG: hypothetical protein ABJD97_01405 [Betaproteobacteria bacterium]